ncbi:hypothetical protein, partial [Gemmiger formicilis]|uniref:hypothetical protein n=1 Tax=Gemmiger formicilis TaxID=745368 RepID=UPI001956A42A
FLPAIIKRTYTQLPIYYIRDARPLTPPVRTIILHTQGKDIAGSISFERPHQEKNTPFVTVLLQLLRQPTTKYV